MIKVAVRVARQLGDPSQQVGDLVLVPVVRASDLVTPGQALHGALGEAVERVPMTLARELRDEIKRVEEMKE